MLHSTATLLSFLCHYTTGEVIPISNPGFETDGPISENSYQYGGSIISGWSIYDQKELNDGSFGVANPIGGTAFNDPTFGEYPPEGVTYGYIEQSYAEWANEGEMGIFQKPSTYVITVDTTYILSVYIGNTKYNCWSENSKEGAGCADHTGFPGYRVQILGANTILAEDDDSLSIPEGQWVKTTVTVTISAGNTNIGKNLKIRLINKNENSGAGEVSFDDVQLEALSSLETKSPTPTPTTSSPTRIPSKQPTITPTLHPTIPPNNDPTASPNNDPTASPINDPTASPTHITTIFPTYNPTDKQTDETTVNTDDIIKDTKLLTAEDNILSTEGAGVKSADNILSISLVLVAASVLLVLCCLCCIVLFIVYKIRETKPDQDDNVEHIEMFDELRNPDHTEVKSVRKEKDQLTVKSFFEYDLSLPEYYTSFVDHGYDSLRAMMMIKTKEDLIPLGITLPGHQSLILAKIKCLREITEGRIRDIDDTTDPTVHVQTEEKYEKLEVEEERLIKAWLDFNVGLAKYKYHETFIENGYESMKAIQAIRNASQLKAIGVTVLGHQTLIMSEIEKLNGNVNTGLDVNMLQSSESVLVGEGVSAEYGFTPPQQGHGIHEMNEELMPGDDIQQMLEKQQLRMQEMQKNIAVADAKIHELEVTQGQFQTVQQ